MGPLLGRFEFDLMGQTAATYSLTILLASFVLSGIGFTRHWGQQLKLFETIDFVPWP